VGKKTNENSLETPLDGLFHVEIPWSISNGVSVESPCNFHVSFRDCRNCEVALN